MRAFFEPIDAGDLEEQKTQILLSPQRLCPDDYLGFYPYIFRFLLAEQTPLLVERVYSFIQ